MDPKLIEILKKAKQIDNAAKKYDNGAPKRSTTSGFSTDIDGTKLLSAEQAGINESYHPGAKALGVKKDIESQDYKNRVTNSKLPAAIQKAMLENPIPQAPTMFDVDEDVAREIRGEYHEEPTYNEEDEIDMYEKPVRRESAPKRKVIREEIHSPVNVDEKYLRKLIASELTKALPKIIEHYFDSRLVKENVQFKAGETIFSGTVMPMPKVKGKG